MRISDWSSDVCSSDLVARVGRSSLPRLGGAGTGAMETLWSAMHEKPQVVATPRTHDQSMEARELRHVGRRGGTPAYRACSLRSSSSQDRKSTRLNSSH